MKMKHLAVAIAATMFAAAPASAIAANVSSNDGKGTQFITTEYGCGSLTRGQLQSTSGNPVYYSGTVVYDNDLDEDFGRHTSDTTSSTLVGRYGTVGTTATYCGADGVKVKICRNKNNLPDSCGSFTAALRP